VTACGLFAVAHGQPEPIGTERCFFCGGPCEAKILASERRSNTFTSFNQVARPDSPWCCSGCVLATDESDKALRPRNHSWVVTRTGAARCTGFAGAMKLRQACIEPPEPPYAIVASVSGQKHLLYLARVNLSRDLVTAQVELEQVTFRPADLPGRLRLAERIVAATGKPSLSGPLGVNIALGLSNYYQDFEPLLEEWRRVASEPLSRLVAFLARNMENCQNEYPTDI
jgi:CRISPR type IV-associated protein Csf1